MSLRDHLQAIYDQHGYLTPKLVVDVARLKTHPLHGVVFSLDKNDAAEAWYLHRAHELIQSVRVVYREATDEDPALKVRQWHAVRTEQGTTYKPAVEVAQDEFATAIVLKDMEREWKALHRRYGSFAEFVDLVRRDLGDQAA